MLKQETTQAGMFGDWQQLNTTLVANGDDLAYLEGSRLKLESVLIRLGGVLTQQAVLTASKQEMSKQLKDLFAEGQRYATVLRKAVAVHYGPRAEKLTEFKIPPFRGRTRKVKPDTPEAPEPPTSPAQ